MTRSRMLATGVAALLAVPVLVIVSVVFPEGELGTWALVAFLVGFALIMLGFLWKGEWLWLVLLVEWCFFPFAWVTVQMYFFRAAVAHSAPTTQILRWDMDPVDVYCNDVLLGQTPLEIDIDRLVRSLAPMESHAANETEIREMTCYDSNAIEMLFDGVPREAQGKYWWNFKCAGHPGLFCRSPNGSLVPSEPREPKFRERVVFPAIYPHAAALIHALQHADYKADDAWVKHTAKYLTPLFPFLNDAAYRDPRIKPALDMAVCETFGIRDAMSEEETGACWARILDSVETKRTFRVPSPEWYAINLLGDRLLPFLYGSYMEERGREDAPPRFRRGIRPVYTCPERFSVRFLPVFYAVGKLRPPALQDRITYDAGIIGEPIEMLRLAYDTRPSNWRRTIPYAFSYNFLPFFENRTHSWEFSRKFPTILAFQSQELTSASVRLFAQSFPSVPADVAPGRANRTQHGFAIDSMASNSRRWGLPLFERLRYLTEMRAPGLVQEFKLPPNCLNPVPTEPSAPGGGAPAPKRGVDLTAPEIVQSTGEERKRYMEFEAQRRAAASAQKGDPAALFNAVASFPNPALDKTLIAVFDETRKSLALPPATLSLIKALIMCNTPATLDALGRWWDENPKVYAYRDWQQFEETTARALIVDAIAHLPRMAEPLAVWMPRLAALDDPQLMAAAVEALESVHTQEAWAVIEKWASSAPAEAAEAAKRTLEEEREEMEKASGVIAGTLEPDALVSETASLRRREIS